MTHTNPQQFNLDYRPDSYWGTEPHQPYRATTRDDIAYPLGEEFLPEYEDDEVEIARIELQSTTDDVISVRARRRQGHITYSIVDEYSTEFKCTPRRSTKPLSMRELINLLETAECLHTDYPGLTTTFIAINLEGGGGDPGDYRDFVSVSSAFYPDLFDYYVRHINEWLRKRSGEEVRR